MCYGGSHAVALNWRGNRVRRRSYGVLTVGFGVLLLGLLVFAVVSMKVTQELRFAAGQDGGNYLPLAESIAGILEEEGEGLRVVVEKSDGSRENASRLSKGEVDLGLVQNDTEGPAGLRALVPLHLGALHFLVRSDSEVRSLSDLQGKKVAVGREQSGSFQVVNALLAHFEISGEVELLPLGIGEACEELEEGKVDALLIVLSLKSPRIDQLVNSGKARFVGIGESAKEGSVIDGFRLSYPFVEPYLIPRFSYAMPDGERSGQPAEAIPTVGIRTILVARKDLPNRVAREVTRLVIENRNELTRRQHDFTLLASPEDGGAMQFPLHPGAAEYYQRHEPGFLVRYAEVIGLLMSLGVALYGLTRTGRRWLEQGRKDRIDEYYLELNEMLDEMLQPMSEKKLDEVQERLQGIRSTALKMLARERLEPDESFRIFQTVLAEASTQVRAKRAELRG